MRHILLMGFAFLCAATMSAAGDEKKEGKDAEQWFKEMEAKLEKAKTLDLSFDVAVEAAQKEKYKGTLAAMSGNKLRLEMSVSGGKTDGKMLMISDGSKKTETVSGEPIKSKLLRTSKDLDLIVRISLARPGIFIPFATPVPNVMATVKDQFPVSGFKLGNKEKVGEREAQRLDYQLAVKGQEPKFAVTVWIDLKTGLPVKRQIVGEDGKEKITVIETYEKLRLDGKLDLKMFELTK